MSFILDALKKSESERRQQQAAGFSSVPSARGNAPAPRWLWPLLGVLLAMNLVVVGGLLLRRDSTPPDVTVLGEQSADSPAPAAVSGRAPDSPAEDFSERVAAAKRDLAPQPEVPSAASTGDRPARPAVSAAVTRPPAGLATLPSLEELKLDGAIDLPPLHIDLHVYNDVPERRFVSINLNKYRENERLSEGPVVRHITREGVVLEYDGRTFALLQ